MNIGSRSRLHALRQSRSAACPTHPWRDSAVLAAVGTGILWILYLVTDSWPGTFCVIAGVAAAGWLSVVRDSRRVASLVASRPGESICGFARSFPRQGMDTLLIRAVYEGVQQELGSDRLPIRASDRFLADLRLDWEGVDDIYRDIADICGRETGDEERNPLYGKVETVADLVRFLQYQPRSA